MKRKISVLTSKSRVEGSSLFVEHTFKSGHTVPVYTVETVSAFNQIIGFAKFINSEYGNVYYRGVSGLYDNILPALMRDRANGMPDDLIKILKRITHDDFFVSSLKLRETIKAKKPEEHIQNQSIERLNKYTVEALLQHYVGKTRFLDVVDNHWIALWMGMHKFKMHGKGNIFCECMKRRISIGDVLECIDKNLVDYKTDIYVYVILMAMPHASSKPIYGINETEDFVEVDLRKALPSIYLRPHAQHALVIRKNDKNNILKEAKYYDMADQVVGILRVRIDIADEWLGQGKLMTQENIFPSPSLDQGYNTLLMHEDIFKHPYQIVKYF